MSVDSQVTMTQGFVSVSQFELYFLSGTLTCQRGMRAELVACCHLANSLDIHGWLLTHPLFEVRRRRRRGKGICLLSCEKFMKNFTRPCLLFRSAFFGLSLPLSLPESPRLPFCFFISSQAMSLESLRFHPKPSHPYPFLDGFNGHSMGIKEDSGERKRARETKMLHGFIFEA